MSLKTAIGIDPGSIVCGYGVLRKEGKSISYVASGEITVPKGQPLPERLRRIYEGLRKAIETYNPDEAVVEKIFFASNIKAALSLGHARGVALLSASVGGIPVFEYSPLEVKKALTGYGRAEKSQVMAMIKAILNIDVALSPDSSDALALALTHLNMEGILYGGGKH
ncbi:MAG: crossover junction endodeoxyribonuclease RuvC [Nitrospirae bacterium]|nr:crossover junction endodeoxyribonuclease RuvC [Nitrospirota bacterium]